jgi:hypothetical protein
MYGLIILESEDRNIALEIEDRELSILTEDRNITLASEDRELSILAEDRNIVLEVA